MTVSELIALLEDVKKTDGDIEVVVQRSWDYGDIRILEASDIDVGLIDSEYEKIYYPGDEPEDEEVNKVLNVLVAS